MRDFHSIELHPAGSIKQNACKIVAGVLSEKTYPKKLESEADLTSVIVIRIFMHKLAVVVEVYCQAILPHQT